MAKTRAKLAARVRAACGGSSRRDDAAALEILIVEDDRTLADDLAATFGRLGHRTATAADLDQARALASGRRFAIVILDRMLPGADGLSFIPWLRERGADARVLVLSALDETEARVAGLNAGADDYLGKPYALEEVLARVTALSRRNSAAPVQLVAGPLELDRLARRVTAGSEPVVLNHREFSLLEYLMLHLNETVTRGMIVRDVWGYDLEPDTNVVDVHVSRLRSKLEAHGCADFLATERGTGYRLSTPAA